MKEAVPQPQHRGEEMKMKSIALHRMEMNVEEEKLCKSPDQRNVPISHMKSEIKKCLCDKIITA